MTLTQKREIWSQSKLCGQTQFKIKKQCQSPLVQSYAAVANAESYEERECRENGNSENYCETKFRSNGCNKFLWMADMIARDALTNTRFALAKQLLHLTEGGVPA